ncbi:MAG: hypothetical protein EPN30_02505 [Actinomycetota bacterium]|nr:MAG: hypothetical protein EPN30_02505 [Actinomycetota bacterium]
MAKRCSFFNVHADRGHLFEDKASGARDDHPGLQEALRLIKFGGTLVVWKLDRLGGCLTHLIEIINTTRNAPSPTAHHSARSWTHRAFMRSRSDAGRRASQRSCLSRCRDLLCGGQLQFEIVSWP